MNTRPLGIDWDAQPLGVENDCEIARRLGCSQSSVCQQRLKRGIAKVALHREVNWDALVDDLGTMPDREIAEREGVALITVWHARKRRGIPAWQKRTLRSLCAGIEKRLGKETDASIAREFGYRVATVQDYRRALGIKPLHDTRAVTATIEWESVGLGTTFDSVMARRLGVHDSTIRIRRVAAGIPAYFETRTCACGNVFDAYKRMKIHCSDECHHAAHVARQNGKDGVLVDLYVSMHALNKDLKRKGKKR